MSTTFRHSTTIMATRFSDDCLREIAASLKSCPAPRATWSRQHGGEEFACILL